LQLVSLGGSALKRKRDKKDLLEDSKRCLASPNESGPHATDKKNRDIPEARQLRFEDDELPLKRLKTTAEIPPK